MNGMMGVVWRRGLVAMGLNSLLIRVDGGALAALGLARPGGARSGRSTTRRRRSPQTRYTPLSTPWRRAGTRGQRHSG